MCAGIITSFSTAIFCKELTVLFLFTDHITDALQNDCEKCSDTQKEMAEKVIRHLYNKKPEQWKQLQEKYDPDNTYVKKYEDRLKKITA
jgi:hypothetical protein